MSFRLLRLVIPLFEIGGKRFHLGIAEGASDSAHQIVVAFAVSVFDERFDEVSGGQGMDRRDGGFGVRAMAGDALTGEIFAISEISRLCLGNAAACGTETEEPASKAVAVL